MASLLTREDDEQDSRSNHSHRALNEQKETADNWDDILDMIDDSDPFEQASQNHTFYSIPDLDSPHSPSRGPTPIEQESPITGHHYSTTEDGSPPYKKARKVIHSSASKLFLPLPHRRSISPLVDQDLNPVSELDSTSDSIAGPIVSSDLSHEKKRSQRTTTSTAYPRQIGNLCLTGTKSVRLNGGDSKLLETLVPTPKAIDTQKVKESTGKARRRGPKEQPPLEGFDPLYWAKLPKYTRGNLRNRVAENKDRTLVRNY